MGTKYTAWYSVDGNERLSCETDWEIEAYLSDIPGMVETDSTRYHDWVVEDCAEDYHHNHDGYESRWPLKFTLYATEDGPALGVFDVEREYEPTFSAREAKP
jgi:hypothetical protein